MSNSLPEHAPPPPPTLPALPTAGDLSRLQTALRNWFAQAGRELPWRRTRNPYHILVAEVMLQQTQVDRVLPRYAAFLAAYPTLEALAAAPTAEVIRQWAGLGYNRRAVNLQRIAMLVLADYGGQFPQEVATLRKLPGIGPYTAGAIACFAFEQDVAFLDTNIQRVVQRVFVGAETHTPAPSSRYLTDLAQTLVPAGQGWHWNQAIMELGALVCTSAAPACWRCPLQPFCRAYSDWRAADEQGFAPASSANPADPADPAETNQTSYQPVQRPRRRLAERAETPFVGSNRYYRGRIIAALRELPAGESLALAALGQHIKPDFQPDSAQGSDWLRGLVRGLCRDGLAEWVPAGDGAEDGAEERVRLPGAC